MKPGKKETTKQLNEMHRRAIHGFKGTMDSIRSEMQQIKSAAFEASEEAQNKKLEPKLKDMKEKRTRAREDVAHPRGSDAAEVFKDSFDKFIKYMLSHIKFKGLLNQIEKEALNFANKEVKKHDVHKGQSTYAYDATVASNPGEPGELSFWAADKTKIAEMIPREGLWGKVADFFSKNKEALVDANNKGHTALYQWAADNGLELKRNENGKFSAIDQTGKTLDTEELTQKLEDKTKGLEATLSKDEFFGKDNFVKYDPNEPVQPDFESHAGPSAAPP